MIWTPQSIPGARLCLMPAFTRHQWTEHTGLQGVTNPGVGEPVGHLDEPCGGFSIGFAADANRPILNYRGGVAYWTFGSGKTWILDASAGAFRFFYIDRVLTLLARVRFAAPNAGTVNTILDNSGSTTANVGFNLSRLTDNKMQMQVFRGTAGTPTVSLTSTGTVNASGDTGWHDIVIRIALGSNNASLQIDRTTPVTGTMSGTSIPAAGTNSAGELTIGSRTGGANNPMLGDLASVVILDQAISEDDLELWRNWNPSPTSESAMLVRSQADDLSPADIGFLHTWFDTADPATMWTTNAQSTPVAANGDKIGYLANKKPWTVGSNLGRDAIQATAGKRPEYRSNQYGSEGAAFFDGVADDPSNADYDNEKNLAFTNWRTGGRFVLAVYQQSRADTGSHIFSSNSAGYYVQTGSGYLAGSRGDGVIHLTTNSVQTQVAAAPEGKNLFAYRQQGANGIAHINGTPGTSGMDLGLFTIANMGRPRITGWDMAGTIAAALVLNADPGPAVARRLVNWFATQKGISAAHRVGRRSQRNRMAAGYRRPSWDLLGR